ncbi:MAG: DUF6069 family protein [Actinoallomurus sp.]
MTGGPAVRPVWVTCVVSCLAAAVAVEAYGLVFRFAGVPMRAAGIGEPKASTIYPGMFAMGVFVAAFWGTLITLVIARYAASPARIYLLVIVPVAVLSLIAPAASPDTPTATKVMLCGGHVLAAAIIIPAVHRGLSRKTTKPHEISATPDAGVSLRE